MRVVTKRISVDMEACADIRDVTADVAKSVAESGLANGTVTVFCVGSTCAVSTTEYEPGLLKDIPRALEAIAPSDISYEHHKTWGDDNGSGHVRATLIGPSLTVPFVSGKLVLGTWQQIVLINLDTSGRKRDVVLQILGE